MNPIKRHIKVKIKSVYGKEMIYPACPSAELFAKLLGVKTFNQRQLETIKEMDYVIELENAYKL